MTQFRPRSFNSMPPVVKNLLIINGLFYLAMMALQGRVDMLGMFAMFNVFSDHFHLHQVITHMFMHAPWPSITHILFNMFALWMFGSPLENIWGSKRFLIYYLITGFGAAALYMGVEVWQIWPIKEAIEAGTATPEMIKQWQIAMNTPMLGASGAVFGLLLGFGMLFPNSIIMLLIPPIPIKAKYFVIIYGLFELFMGVGFRSDGIAHFAHLGGMLFGFILIKFWNKTNRNTFY